MVSIPSSTDVQPPAVPGQVGDVTSSAGEYFRLEGIRVLSARYRELSERAKRRMPTPVERKELDRCEAALNTLQAMGRTDA